MTLSSKSHPPLRIFALWCICFVTIAGAAEEYFEIQPQNRSRFKSDLVLPLPSLIFPGFGQYFQGETEGLIYSGIALGGILLIANGQHDIKSGNIIDTGLVTMDNEWADRKITLGNLAYQGSGFVSAYSAFRSSVPRFQAENGRYLFLKKREPLSEVLTAPFQFNHLQKATTYIPLGLLGGLMGYVVYNTRNKHAGSKWALSGDDPFFYGPVAYNAGMSEEAAFRGYLLPLAYEYTGQHFWLANGSQALFFGLLHLSSENPYPWPQTLFGYYLGYLTKKNQWTLSEAIFVHAWWDAIVFAGVAATSRWEYSQSASFRINVPLPL